jgi:hypothetical protein
MKATARTKGKAAVAAREFAAACKAAGWQYAVREGIVTIRKHFAPGDEAEFVRLDGEYYGLLALVPARGGSIWGTDGGGVGGYSAILHGCFTMNVSGVNKGFAAALAAI